VPAKLRDIDYMRPRLGEGPAKTRRRAGSATRRAAGRVANADVGTFDRPAFVVDGGARCRMIEGWRIPLLLSAVLVVVGDVIWRRIGDSPTFVEVKKDWQCRQIPSADGLANVLNGGTSYRWRGPLHRCDHLYDGRVRAHLYGDNPILRTSDTGSGVGVRSVVGFGAVAHREGGAGVVVSARVVQSSSMAAVCRGAGSGSSRMCRGRGRLAGIVDTISAPYSLVRGCKGGGVNMRRRG